MTVGRMFWHNDCKARRACEILEYRTRESAVTTCLQMDLGPNVLARFDRDVAGAGECAMGRRI